MTLNKSWFTQFPDYAVAICPVTGRWGFQNTQNDRQSYILSKFHKSKKFSSTKLSNVD